MGGVVHRAVERTRDRCIARPNVDDDVAAMAQREVALQPQRRPVATLRPRKKSNKVKGVVIGAAIGGGIGIVSGAVYCRADCGEVRHEAPSYSVRSAQDLVPSADL